MLTLGLLFLFMIVVFGVMFLMAIAAYSSSDDKEQETPTDEDKK